MSKQGFVQILLESADPLYAADVLDHSGSPVLPRQEPFRKRVLLFMTYSEDPDEGAYVDVRIDPPQALTLIPTGDGTCEKLSGAFRCTAADDGTASFMVESVSDWSGRADIRLVGRNDREPLVINPAGLPAEATNFRLVIGTVDNDSDRIGASYHALSCTIDPLPEHPFNKWPTGAIRTRPAFVTATPPAAHPSVVRYAPVIIQSLHPEAMLAPTEQCEARKSQLRVMLDELGQSKAFFLCFSDLGGERVRIAYNSGQKTNEDQGRELIVDPEPRLLRVKRLREAVAVGTVDVPVVEVSAFDANLSQVSMPVDVTSTAPTVLVPSAASLLLSGANNPPQQVVAEAANLGTAEIRITPRLYASPVCSSGTIRVE